MLKSIGKEMFPRIFKALDKKVWKGPEYVIPGRRTCDYNFITIQPNQWTSLKRLCEKNQVTINSALNALTMTSLWKYLHKEEGEHEYHFALKNAIDLRKFKTNDPFQMQVYVCTVHSDQDVNGNCLFWDMAKNCQGFIQKGMIKGAQMFSLIRFVDKHLVDFQIKNVENRVNGREDTIFISNLGLNMFPEYFGENQVLSAAFAQGHASSGAMFNLYITTAHKNAPIEVNISYSRTIMSIEKMDIFTDIFNDVLQKLVLNSDVKKDWIVKEFC